MLSEIVVNEFIQNIFKSNEAFFDSFFKVYSFLGSLIFIMIIIPFIYWNVNKKQGSALAATMLVSLFFNNLFKNVFKRARPYTVDPNLSKGVIEPSYSFPSGHSQLSSTLASSLFINIKNKVLRVLFVIYVLIMMLSRIYLGVHYLSDVVVGALLGVLFSYLISLLYDKFQIYIFILMIVLSFILVLIFPVKDVYLIFGSSLGISSGIYLENKYVNFKMPTSKTIVIYRTIVGLLLVILTYYGLKLLFSLIGDYLFLDAIRYGLTCFVGFYVAPLVFNNLKIKGRLILC